MNTKLIKGLIIGITVIILIIAVILVVIINTSGEDGSQISLFTGSEEGEIGEQANSERHNVDDQTSYYIVKDCVDVYLECLNKTSDFFNYSGEYSEEMQREYLYSLLNEKCVVENNITESNVLSKFNLYKESINFLPVKMQVAEGEISSRYVVYGIVQTIDYKYVKDLYLIVDVDKNNKTFAIYPLKDSYADIEDINTENPNKEIAKNDYNIYVEPNVTAQYIANHYINTYKGLALTKPEIIYNLMPEKYKQKRYNTLESFKTYVSNNKDNIKKVLLSQYIVNYEEDYIEYYEKDQFGHIYIFREDSELGYTIQLDGYTLENAVTKPVYDEATNMNRGLIDADKFFEMINMQDYTTAYNTLDENFRNTYFKNQATFEKYIQSKLFKYNKVTYQEYNDQLTDIHGYKVLVEDATGANKKQVEFNILIKLIDSSEFVLSFAVN